MRPGRTHVRNLFLRLLGGIFLAAFLSLYWQIPVLFGSHGLLPATTYLESFASLDWLDRVLSASTIFWIDCNDGVLRGAALAGAVLSFGLMGNVAPRWCLTSLWLLYLSFVTIGQDFLSFQWDNLLLESAFFALFVTPRGLRPKHAEPPHPIAIFLMLWLVVRLHVESGAAKLLSGDPTWRDLTAMVSYYETAPLPTWLGWYAHQMPEWAHRACALFTFVVELALPLLFWAPRRLRAVVFLFLIAMQVSIVLTANYCFFNYLSMALCLFVLDDSHLNRLASRFGIRLSPPPPPTLHRGRTLALALVAIVLVPLSVVPFLPFLQPPRALMQELAPVRRFLNTVRSVNAYHLFAQMTLVRKEAVIEGSTDGATWQAYEFHYKPGDPNRAPAFVAPHQPRVDFQLWFLLLGGPPRARYFNTLLTRLLEEPAAVAPLFARDPFADAPPRFVRIAVYRYRFTDATTRRATGAWWQRELLGYSQPVSRDSRQWR